MIRDRPVRKEVRSIPPTRRAAVPPAVRRPIGVVAVLGALLVAIPAPFYAGDTGPGRIDRWVQSALDGTHPAARRVALGVDWVGEPVGRTLVVATLATACLVLGRRRLAIAALAGTLLTSVATTVLKPVVERRIHGEFLSYPSGHTAFAVTVATVVALLVIDVRGLGPVGGAWVLAGLVAFAGLTMGWAEVALGAHYPTDTFGGFGVAVAVVPVVALAVDRLTSR